MCRADNGSTWNKSLCVPMIIIDRDSNIAVTSQRDHEGKFRRINNVFVGHYSGPMIYANTSIMWNGVRWSMALWPLPEDKIERTQLLLHEAFHSIQDEIGLPMNNAMNDHLDQEEARVLVRLEWNALLQALEHKNQQSKHIANALWYRQKDLKSFQQQKRMSKNLK